jgi:hypothetical protein
VPRSGSDVEAAYKELAEAKRLLEPHVSGPDDKSDIASGLAAVLRARARLLREMT